MELNVTSLIKQRKIRGLTLIEVMVSLAISGVLMTSISEFVISTSKSFAATVNYVELDRRSRNALDQMIFKVRQADKVLKFEPTEIIFSYYRTNRLAYKYSPGARTLTETLGTKQTVLLTECDFVEFSMFQRNTREGTYEQFPANMTNSVAKLIQVNWKCSRSIEKIKLTTESVHSAKIVLRNQ